MKNNKRDSEYELRGKVLAMSLEVENQIARLIYSFFYPKTSDKETINIFLNDFILTKTFSNKKEILQKIYKTERYKSNLNKNLLEKNIIGPDKELKNYEAYTKYLINLLTEIIKERNIIAHGTNFSSGFMTLQEDELILANKSKFYKYSSNDYLEKFKEKSLKAFLMLTMVKVER